MSTGTRQPLQLAILISGRGSNMAAIARACLDGSINARVSVVISDRPGVPGLTTARDLGIETHIVPSTRAPSGVGEPGTPPVAPALANALFVLTGTRLRELPLRLTSTQGMA